MEQPISRCFWAKEKIFHTYHDHEWGRPLQEDQALFELLVLEGMQAGLSWATILKKRANFQQVFDGFSIQKVASYDKKKIETILQNKGIIRHRGKIEAAIKNAKIVQYLEQKEGSFSNYIWSFTKGKVIDNRWASAASIPSKSRLSEKISKELQLLGGKFVGPTIIYAFLQAAGIVNDHEAGCFTRSTRLQARL